MQTKLRQWTRLLQLKTFPTLFHKVASHVAHISITLICNLSLVWYYSMLMIQPLSLGVYYQDSNVNRSPLSRGWAESATACMKPERLASQCRLPGMLDLTHRGSSDAFNPCVCVRCVSVYIPVIVLGQSAPLFNPQVGEISFSGDMRRRKGKPEREEVREGASSGKVQQIPTTPAPCLSWARLWWKARDKTWRENPFSSSTCCSVSHSNGCFTPCISLCACGVWTMGRFGHGTSLFSAWCSSQREKRWNLGTVYSTFPDMSTKKSSSCILCVFWDWIQLISAIKNHSALAHLFLCIRWKDHFL